MPGQHNAFRTRQPRQHGLVPGGLEHRILLAKLRTFLGTLKEAA